MDDLLSVKVPAPETKPLDAPDPSAEGIDPRTVIQSLMLAIAMLTVAYFAGDVILPIVLAFVVSLLFHPLMRALEKWGIPRGLTALAIILLLFAVIVGIGAALSGPAASWAQKLPGGLGPLEERLKFLSEPIRTLQTFLHQFDNVAPGGGGGSGPSLAETLFRGAQHFAAGFFEMLVILFFLLVSGETFLRRLVEVFPDFGDKKRVVAVSQQIQEHVSVYLVTVTAMNAAVGVATGLAMWACGLGDPVLWGAAAFLLNYMPFIGPAMGVVLFLFVGLLTMDELWRALAPAGAYLIIHVIEGEAVTPMLLARRFTLNPAIVIISLIFWFWMWGVPGAVLAVPMLAVAKIVCDEVKPLASIGHFLEG
jgi:predicted PurR-regulated permease PerM